VRGAGAARSRRELRQGRGRARHRRFRRRAGVHAAGDQAAHRGGRRHRPARHRQDRRLHRPRRHGGAGPRVRRRPGAPPDPALDRPHRQPALRRVPHAFAPAGGVQRPPRDPGRRVQDSRPPDAGEVRPVGRAGPRARARRGRAEEAHGPLGVLCGEMSPSSTRLRLDWVAPVLLPAVNLTVALLLSAVVVLLIGESPGRALRTLASGAFGDAESIGYTLYYASNFVFTGLAVAVAFHCGLFNIGAEGQAYIGGLGVALFCLGAGSWPTVLVVPVAIVVAAVGGAAWAFVPAWLQAHRGS